MVVGVVALLALMAIPSLRDGALRKQVDEGLALADVAKGGVQAARTATGEMPADNKEAGVPDERAVPIAWLCHGAGVPKGMEVRGRDETDVPNEWRPVACRARSGA